MEEYIILDDTGKGKNFHLLSWHYTVQWLVEKFGISIDIMTSIILVLTAWGKLYCLIFWVKHKNLTLNAGGL